MQLGFVLMLPPAVLLADWAGSFWYVRDHAIVERTHMRNPRYFEILNGYEAAGGIVGALPGLAVLLTLKGMEKRKQRETVTGQPVDDGDETVWPPPPKSDTPA